MYVMSKYITIRLLVCHVRRRHRHCKSALSPVQLGFCDRDRIEGLAKPGGHGSNPGLDPAANYPSGLKIAHRGGDHGRTNGGGLTLSDVDRGAVLREPELPCLTLAHVGTVHRQVAYGHPGPRAAGHALKPLVIHDGASTLLRSTGKVV